MPLKSEATIHKVFTEKGYAESFDFIGKVENGKKDVDFSYRCKRCGEISTRTASYYLYRYPRLICAYCGASSDGKDLWTRSQQADEVADYYVQGHSVADTADRFGISTCQVNNLAKQRHLTNGRSFRESANLLRKENAEKRLADIIESKGLEYVGGYSGKRGKVLIRCKKCGAEFERTVSFLQNGNVICPECQKREAVEREEERRRISKQNAEVRRLEQEWHRMTHPPKDERREKLLDKTGICEVCGKPYTVREYVESCGLKYARDNGVCSAECKKIKTRQIVKESHKGRQDSHRHRAKKFGCAYDGTVTLKKLIKRDGLRCAICGGMCDPNDHSWSKYFGATSPTIDHIIPMAKGGGHTWDNVQVAHAICNSYKGDNLSEVG